MVMDWGGGLFGCWLVGWLVGWLGGGRDVGLVGGEVVRLG